MKIGEASITPQHMQAITPDIVSKQGLGQLSQTMQAAVSQKSKLDTILKSVAQSFKADFSSRIKNPETVVQKIAQKRLAGRKYGLGDVNDPYGARIVVDSNSQVSAAAKKVVATLKENNLTVIKSENVKDDTYKAYHVDFQTPSGVRGEAQVMTPKQQMESMANHSIRAVYGEKPPGFASDFKDAVAQIAGKTPNDKAKAISGVLAKLSKAQNDKPISPQIIASVIQQAS